MSRRRSATWGASCMRRARSRATRWWHGSSASAAHAASQSIAARCCSRRGNWVWPADGIRRRWFGSPAILTAGRGKCSMDVQEIRAITERVRGEVRKAVVGQDAVIDLMLTSLLVGGHILLEGVPGTAKTMITRAFAAGLLLQFGRIQFTPDLMPGDVLGTNLFNFQTNGFVLTKGPIFTQLLLADEINRTPPKTQAALLQAMNERAVTIDGANYPLGEAQLDRFLVKIVMDNPGLDEEREIVRRHGHRSAMPRLADFGLEPVAD